MQFLKQINQNKYLFTTYKILRIVAMVYVVKVINDFYPALFIPTFTLIGYFFAQRLHLIKETPFAVNLIFSVFMIVTGVAMLLRGAQIITFDFNPFYIMSGAIFGITIYILRVMYKK